MTRPAFTVLVALAACVVASCETSSPLSPASTTSAPAGSGANKDNHPLTNALMGSWQATRAVACKEGVPGSRRDLVADGGTVTLLLEPNSQRIGNAFPPGRYTISVAMPGGDRRQDAGFWFFGPAWQTQYQGLLQMDFYPDRLLPHPDYGDLSAFLVSLSDDQRVLKLWDSGLSILPHDFGSSSWDTVLELDFVRQ